MRKENSIKNIVASVTSNIITIGIGIIAQAIFIKILGNELLGINSLFNNIISMLSIVELGMGTAIIYNLYKPIAENETEKVKSLMNFYKKSYRVIALIVCFIGGLIIPFLKYIIDINTINANINIYIIYLLFLSDSVFSYFLSYKRSILYANQKNYIVNIIHIICITILNIIQIIILFFTKNFYLYLMIKVIMKIIENMIITFVANKLYSFLNEKDYAKLDKSVEKDIFTKIKALFFHKIGTFVILGTDNIIISKFLGIVVVGMYSNYYLIINSVQTVFNQIIQALTPSLGNLLVTESKEKQFITYKRIRFINFWITAFSSIAILIIMESFIKIWIGNNYILPRTVLYILVLNYYLNSSRATYIAFKDAAGIYYEDRFIPLFESLINIIVSILLVKKLGLVGVFLGTIVSGLVLWCYSYPKYVYKLILKRNYFDYAKENIGYLVLFIITAFITVMISNSIHVQSIAFQFFYNVIIALIVPNLIMLLFFIKDEKLVYFFDLFKEIKNKIQH